MQTGGGLNSPTKKAYAEAEVSMSSACQIFVESDGLTALRRAPDSPLQRAEGEGVSSFPENWCRIRRLRAVAMPVRSPILIPRAHRTQAAGVTRGISQLPVEVA